MDKNTFLIFTGRFQPVHYGHINLLLETRKRYPENPIIVCIIEKGYERNTEDIFAKNISKFLPQNNQLPNWERYMLLNYAIKEFNILNDNLYIIFRSNPNIDWERSLIDLPLNRIWVFPRSVKEIFDVQKKINYINRGENFIEIETNGYDNYHGTVFRTELLSGNTKDLSFMPNNCHDYFINNCLKYYENDIT